MANTIMDSYSYLGNALAHVKTGTNAAQNATQTKKYPVLGVLIIGQFKYPDS